MKEEPALSINITEKTFCLCMLAAQQLLNTINSKKGFRAIVERSPEAKKITIKIYPKDIPVEQALIFLLDFIEVRKAKK